MSKYIDSDKLIAEIERLYYNESEKDESILAADAYKNALDAVEKVIASLQQEQPSLPSDIDKAAEEYSENILANNEDLQDAIEDAFKEGAKWMAEQGITVGGTFHHSSGYPSVIELNTYLRDYEGADVIVQVRKKQ